MNPTDAEPRENRRKIICHASGDRCHGCAHYQGKADQCVYAPSPDAGTGTRDNWSLIEWQNKERLTVTWNHWHGAFIVQGQHQVCGNMGQGRTVIEALRAARAAKSEGGE